MGYLYTAMLTHFHNVQNLQKQQQLSKCYGKEPVQEK